MTPFSLFATKIEQTNKDPRKLHIWIRFCEEIRSLNRRDCYDYLDHYLPQEKLLDALVNTTEFSQIAPLLLRLHKLNPKMAATVITETFHQFPQLIEQLLRNDSKIITLSNDLFVLSRLNRRLAFSTAFQLKEKIESLMSAEVHYNEVASVLNQLRTSVSPQLAREAAQSVNKQAIVSDFQRDLRRVSMVGRSLYNIAQVSQGLADWIGQRLSYEDFIKGVHSRLAYSYTHLIRGFLVAADPLHRREQLLGDLTSDHILIKELRHMWTQCNLTEVGFFLSHLLSIPIGIHNILDLIEVDNLGTFRKQLLRKFSEENSTLHFTNGLFAIAKIDLSLASEALDIYIDRVKSEVSQNAPAPQRRNARRPQLPRDYQSDDLTDIGCLLRIAAAIDRTRSYNLAELLDIDSYSAYASKETNWGRLAVFIRGLSEASRMHAIKFVKNIGKPEIWETQYFENDVLDNAVHYALSLGIVSRAKAGEFIRFLMQQDKTRNDIYHLLEVQANLELISRWLRLLPMGGPDFLSTQFNRLSGFLSSTADYDQRLHALLATSEALIDCGELNYARDFAVRAIQQESQMRSVTQLHQWIDLFHRALRISRELNMPDFVMHLFSSFKDWYFFPKIVAPVENQPLLLAYTFHLLDSRSDFPELQRGVRERHGEILKVIRIEKRAVVKTISLILAKGSVDEIKQAANNIEWGRAWEAGLLALTFASTFPDKPNPLISSLLNTPAWEQTLMKDLTSATGNLEFALTLYLAKASSISEDLLKESIAEAHQRADDEVVGSTRWLLRGTSSATIDQGHHYLWSLIKRTLLSQTYLSWENDLEEVVNNAAFQLRQARDFEALLA